MISRIGDLRGSVLSSQTGTAGISATYAAHRRRVNAKNGNKALAQWGYDPDP
ncbi:MAG: hypothetical protein GXO91_05910 [FCB group bacterium]|nr:hypothetical protein [FCB group bacterium]